MHTVVPEMEGMLDYVILLCSIADQILDYQRLHHLSLNNGRLCYHVIELLVLGNTYMTLVFAN